MKTILSRQWLLFAKLAIKTRQQFFVFSLRGRFETRLASFFNPRIDCDLDCQMALLRRFSLISRKKSTRSQLNISSWTISDDHSAETFRRKSDNLLNQVFKNFCDFYMSSVVSFKESYQGWVGGGGLICNTLLL